MVTLISLGEEYYYDHLLFVPGTAVNETSFPISNFGPYSITSDDQGYFYVANYNGILKFLPQ